MSPNEHDGLSELAEREEFLLAELRSPEPLAIALRHGGIGRAYADVHRGYVQLAETGDLEALKRAIFLQWFQVAEPAFLSGIGDLDADAMTCALALVDKLCSSNLVDEEFQWMLVHY